MSSHHSRGSCALRKLAASAAGGSAAEPFYAGNIFPGDRMTHVYTAEVSYARGVIGILIFYQEQ